MSKPLAEYTVVELKAMAFETAHQITLLRTAQTDILGELVKRKALPEKVEITPDEL